MLNALTEDMRANGSFSNMLLFYHRKDLNMLLLYHRKASNNLAIMDIRNISGGWDVKEIIARVGQEVKAYGWVNEAQEKDVGGGFEY